VIIESYIKKNEDLEFVDFYIDDGYSGTTFDRLEYKRMLKDIVEGKVNTIIVKDLSRFGRNHIESDNYIENILPGYNVRFISIIDDVDSFKNPKSVSSIAVPLKNLMNDQYARDISEKVRSTLKIKQLNGEFIGVTAPYGYLKNPKDKHKFIIDKEASYIVKKMFNMILLGKSRKEIAEYLNNKNVLTPSLYKLSKENINNEDLIRSKKWNAEIVNRILRNETYIGTLIQNIKTKPNYRTDKLIDVKKDEWIITENHHEQIISKDKFDEVQQILNRKTKVNKNDDIDLFSGYLKCSHCGSGLVIKKSKNQIYYYCSSYIKDKSCLKYSINKKKLEQIVKDEIIKKINIEQLDRKVLNELIEMIYVIDKNNIKIEFKNI
jgi:DNA invertase Pin-like site-specific DNA recombinase